MLDKFILTQCGNCKIMWITMTDKDTFQCVIVIGFQLILCWVLLRYSQLIKWMENIWDFLTKPDQLETIFRG